MKKPPSVVYWLGDNLYLNITNRCPNDCYFCFRRYWSGIEGFNLKLLGEPSIDEVIMRLQGIINKRHWREVVFCGFGEPLVRLDCVLEVTRWIKGNFRGTVRIDTNGQGYLLNQGRDVVRELREAGVDKVSISLNAHDRETYDHVCRPSLEGAYESVLGFIERARGAFETEITAVTIPEVNVDDLRELAKKMGVEFRLRGYIPCFW